MCVVSIHSVSGLKRTKSFIFFKSGCCSRISRPVYTSQPALNEDVEWKLTCLAINGFPAHLSVLDLNKISNMSPRQKDYSYHLHQRQQIVRKGVQEPEYTHDCPC